MFLRNSFRELFFAFFLILLPSYPPNLSLHAADSASLQLAVASPDPVQAGSELFFQVILANSGDVKWETGRYYFEVQIYDSEKNYLNKTKRILGDKDVPPGDTALVFIPWRHYFPNRF